MAADDVLEYLNTERCNADSKEMDRMTPEELLILMNREDEKAVRAVREAVPEIAKAVELVIAAFRKGGRLIYAGAGTSGRLGILDAVECGPTFSAAEKVIGILAGGDEAFVSAKEGAEDSEEVAAQELRRAGLKKEDVVMAIAASGRTPYCIGALKAAKAAGALCISLACNKGAQMSKYADVAIEVDAGPEVLTGSTRLKAGTCQKLILNMISTASMVGIGKVYGNYMVDMKATNYKLEKRAVRMLMSITGCSEEEAVCALKESGMVIKTAIVMLKENVSKEEAEQRLLRTQGFVRKCIE